MMRNLELKYRCPNPEAVWARALEMGARDGGVWVQQDTFFAAPGGRLKLREVDGREGELISYRRPDSPGVSASDYRIYRTPHPASLAETLGHVLPVTGVVRKRRRLLLYRHTRVHLDEVEGLGTFVELETVLEGLNPEAGRRELEEVAAALGLPALEPVAVAYADLLTR